MKKIFLSTIIVCSINQTMQAQDSINYSIKKIQLSEVAMSYGLFTHGTKYASSYNDIYQLTTNSQLLNTNLDLYQKSIGSVFTGNSVFSIYAGFKSSKPNALNPLIRIGFTGFNLNNAYYSFYQTTTKPYDTLVSQSTGEKTVVDSITTKNYNVSKNSTYGLIDLSIILRSNQQKRFSVFGGLGVSAGYSLNSITTVAYSEFHKSSDKQIQSSTNYSYKSESHDNKTHIISQVSVPFGIDFCLGKKRTFWKHAHLYYELKPSITSYTIPELKKSNTNFAFMSMFGVKATLVN